MGMVMWKRLGFARRGWKQRWQDGEQLKDGKSGVWEDNLCNKGRGFFFFIGDHNILI